MLTPRGGEQASRVAGRGLHPGSAAGPLTILDEPVSFWGGVSADGTIIDVHHPQQGRSLGGCVLAMTTGRGSSSASSVLAEQIRAGAAPAAIVVTEPDVILVLGAVVAAELYGLAMPILQIAPADYAGLPRRAWAEVDVASAPAARDSEGMTDPARATATMVVTAA